MAQTFTVKLSPRFLTGKADPTVCICELHSWFRKFAVELCNVSATPFTLVKSSIVGTSELWFEFEYDNQTMNDSFSQVVYLSDPDYHGVFPLMGSLVTSDWLNRDDLVNMLF